MKVLALVCLFGIAVASYEATFANWMVEHGKHYATPEEYSYRLKVFTDNAKLIEAENAKGNSWELGFTKMADLTLEEYRAKFLIQMANQTAPVNAMNTRAVTPVDWRTGGCVTGVKDQGQCGSCYSFSATASMEYCHCKAAGSLVSLSEQQCVDCSMSYGNLACSGGWQENCWKYYAAFGGEDTESGYPYTAVRGTCKASTPTAAKVTSYSTCTATEAGLQSCIVGHVTSVAIDASLASFQLYKSGIYCPTGCSSTTLDHAVTAVGQQTSSSGDYYIVKNSWGTGWGISGYIWMCANHNNNCGICTHANYPTGCS